VAKHSNTDDMVVHHDKDDDGDDNDNVDMEDEEPQEGWYNSPGLEEFL
jgi:hypothetical protein